MITLEKTNRFDLEKLAPAPFNDKDIMLPEYWDITLVDYYEYLPFCVSPHFTEAVFYTKKQKLYCAKVLSREKHIIEVTALKDNGTIWLDDAYFIKELFMRFNKDEDSELYVTCKETQESDGRLVKLTFKHYHK